MRLCCLNEVQNLEHLKQCQKLAHDPEVAFIHSVICIIMIGSVNQSSDSHHMYSYTDTHTHARHSMANFHFDIVTAVYIYLDT